MSRNNKKRHNRRKNIPTQTPVSQQKTLATEPWLKLVRALSCAGVVLTLYLAWVAWQGSQLAFCEQGSSCSIIQSSQWSKFLGIPLALWGAGLYALLALSAFGKTGKLKQWQRLWKLSFFGVLISTYLTITGIVALDAVCGWCLTSFALLVVIFGLVMANKPSNGMGLRPGVWWASHASVGLLIVGAMFASGADLWSKRGDPRLHELAQHLSQTEAKFYGAYWCPSCMEQKKLFSGAVDKLPYVECSPGGRNSPMTSECVRAGVSGYPTWVINGKTHVGVVQPTVLAALSGYDWNNDKKE